MTHAYFECQKDNYVFKYYNNQGVHSVNFKSNYSKPDYTFTLIDNRTKILNFDYRPTEFNFVNFQINQLITYIQFKLFLNF